MASLGGARDRCWPGWTRRSRRAPATSATWRPGRGRCSTCSPRPWSRDPSAHPIGWEPAEDEVPRRERLRWEKELLGLYLSEHPLGDIADQLPEYVTAYTGDLAEESDQARVTLGGIIQSTRRVVTRAGSTMLVATLEDLQGSVEIVVFPKVFAETANFWADDSVVLVSGRVDRRDDAAQLLCESVHAWDDAARMGPVAFGAERDRLLRSRGGRAGGGMAAWWRLARPAMGRPGARRGIRHAGEPMLVRARWCGSGRSRGGAVHAVPRLRRTVGLARPHRVPRSFPWFRRPAAASEESRRPRRGADRVSPPGAGTIQIGFEAGIALERLLPAIESVTQAVRESPRLAAGRHQPPGCRANAAGAAAPSGRMGRAPGRDRAPGGRSARGGRAARGIGRELSALVSSPAMTTAAKRPTTPPRRPKREQGGIDQGAGRWRTHCPTTS